VPVDEDPPLTEVGFMVKEVTVTGVTASAAVCVFPAYVADKVIALDEATKLVVTGNVIVAEPGGTLTVAGT
jgi:hypothetical protein